MFDINSIRNAKNPVETENLYKLKPIIPKAYNTPEKDSEIREKIKKLLSSQFKI